MSTSPDATLPEPNQVHEATILVVDDSPVERRFAGAMVEKHGGWRPAYAGNGVEALAFLEREPVDAVLTDLQMPEINGLELVETIRNKFPRVPVILMTAHGSEDIAIQALRSGAVSYVPKKDLARDLAGVLEQVLSAAKFDRHRQLLLSCLTHRESRFQLQNDPALIPPFITMLQEDLVAMKLCTENGRIRIGVALEEALLNALYHGNLEVSSDLRQHDDRAYQNLAQQRRGLTPYRDRQIFVEANVNSAEARFVIRDEGPGFDLATLPDPTDPANLGRSSGRGLLLIRTFMDLVSYNPTGNQVTMLKRRQAEGKR